MQRIFLYTCNLNFNTVKNCFPNDNINNLSDKDNELLVIKNIEFDLRLNDSFLIGYAVTENNIFTDCAMSNQRDRHIDNNFKNGAYIYFEYFKGNILIVNDFMGLIPLYYYQKGDITIISNSFKIISKLVTKIINKDAIYEYLLTGANFSHNTILKNVNQLTPASKLVFNSQTGLLEVSIRDCFASDFENNAGFESIKESFKISLTKAVQRLYKKDFKYREFIHRLVAFSFIENTNNKPFINHKNGIKTDNIVDNLEWCTQKENVNHAYRTKLRIPDIGQSKGTSKLKNTDIPIIRKMLKESSHTYKEIGDIYKVSSSAIKLIKYNKNWVNF